MRALLERAGLSWIDDPSNANLRFERVRERKRLADEPALHDRMIALAESAASARIELAQNAAAVIDRHAGLTDAATIALGAGFLQEAGTAGTTHAMRLLLATAGGGEHLPDHDRTTALLESLRSGSTGASLANARVESRGEAVILTRDRRGRAGPVVRLGSPYDELLPSFDVEAAKALARLLGQPDPALPAT